MHIYSSFETEIDFHFVLLEQMYYSQTFKGLWLLDLLFNILFSSSTKPQHLNHFGT